MTLTEMLDALNRYSNLILVAVTVAYVVVTWLTVREMRHAREAALEPFLVATLIPFGNKNVKLRIRNAGQGPAFTLKATIQLIPANDTTESAWRHPVLLSGAYEEFFMPGTKLALEKLATDHDKVAVNLTWSDAFRRTKQTKVEFDLKLLLEGWSRVGFIMQPDDLLTQLDRISGEMTKIREQLEKPEQERKRAEFLEAAAAYKKKAQMEKEVTGRKEPLSAAIEQFFKAFLGRRQ